MVYATCMRMLGVGNARARMEREVDRRRMCLVERSVCTMWV